MSQIRGFILIYQAIFTPHEIPDRKRARRVILFITLFSAMLFGLFTIPTLLELRQLKSASWELTEQELSVENKLPALNGPLYDANLTGVLQFDDVLNYEEDGKLRKILLPFTHSQWQSGDEVTIFLQYRIYSQNRDKSYRNIANKLGLKEINFGSVPFTGVFKYEHKVATSTKDEMIAANYKVSDDAVYVKYVKGYNSTDYNRIIKQNWAVVLIMMKISLGIIAFGIFVYWRLYEPEKPA